MNHDSLSKPAARKRPPPAARRKRNCITVGRVKLPWYRAADGRTFVDPRGYGRPIFAKKDHDAALTEGHRLAAELNAGGVAMPSLSPEQRAEYGAIARAAARHGTTVPGVTAEWSAARSRIAPCGRELLTVIDAGVAALTRAPHLVADVGREFIATKRVQDLDGRYLRGIESTWTLLGERFAGDIRDVTPGDLAKLLDGEIDPASGQRVGGLRKSHGELLGTRRRDNILDEIRQGFQYARIRKYLPDEISAARQVPMIHKLGGPISFFTVVEARLILEHVAEEWLPFVVLALFCGPRSGELALSKDAKKSKDPLRWDDFDWDEREILMRDVTAKMQRTRRVPLLDNAYEWLLPHKGNTGYVIPKGRRPDREFGKGMRLESAINAALAAAPRLQNELPVQLHLEAIVPEPPPLLTEFAWRNNALRHSYGSYRQSIIRSLDQLSDEMGNSPAICAQHYRNPRPKSQALAYFRIFPPKAVNVVSMHAAEWGGRGVVGRA